MASIAALTHSRKILRLDNTDRQTTHMSFWVEPRQAILLRFPRRRNDMVRNISDAEFRRRVELLTAVDVPEEDLREALRSLCGPLCPTCNTRHRAPCALSEAA